MTKFALEIFMTVGIALILYLLARALPRINDTEVTTTPIIKNPWILAYIEKLDLWFEGTSEKTLRRVKIWILKLDNAVTKKLNGFKKDSSKESKLL